MGDWELIATSAFGLEAVVRRELAGLGYEASVSQPGRVSFFGDRLAICRANIRLRTAERVRVCLGRFEATDFGQLFDCTHQLTWEQWLPPDANFPVSGRSLKSQLSSVPACQRMVKKAIVERLKSAHQVDELDETGPLFAVEVALLNDTVTLTVDTTGNGLHKRGYRPLTGKAPLRETLAAAMVMLSFWNRDRPLIDPFCGTGTIPIEAAMIGRSIAPGLGREFMAETWPSMDAALWQKAKEEARELILPDLGEQIMGTDIDPRAVEMARRHAESAGVANDIHFQQRAFEELSSRKEYGCLICNPPYGHRLSDDGELESLYQSFPNVLRRLPTWSHFILTGRPQFEGSLGQTADRRRKLYNGRIECQYFQFHGPKKTDAVQSAKLLPVFGGLDETADRQANEFRNRLLKRARHLRRWPQKGITCYRLYERDIPEVPLVVDRYEDRLHIAEFARPHDRTPGQHAEWLDLMAKTAGEVLDVARGNVFIKFRDRQRGTSQYERRGSEGHLLTVHEGGLKFQVNLSDYLDTGLFLDHRITRDMVRAQAEGRRMLNLFGYTGSFSVYAAAGGTVATTTVDRSKTYLAWAKENLQLNGFEGTRNRLVHADAMTYLRDLDQDVRFDLAVVDPPTFSNSKDLDHDWDVQRDHVQLLNRLIEFISPGGAIFFSTNSRRFKLEDASLTGLNIHEISRQTVPPDFRNRRIHRCWRMVKK